MKKAVAVVAVALCAVIALAGFAVRRVSGEYADRFGAVAMTAPLTGGVYYTRVDNGRVTRDDAADDEMPFRYELVAYAEDGSETSTVFRTSRELRDGAYLRFEAAFLRGMITWEEVQADELPDAVRARLG